MVYDNIIMADFYLKVDGDPDFEPRLLEIDDDLEMLLNQIEMILFTRQGDILGEDSFGSNIEDLVYSSRSSARLIETSIYNQVSAYCPLARNYKTEVDIRFFEGAERDIAVIDIVINGERRTGLLLT